jgi:hypothetical protein
MRTIIHTHWCMYVCMCVCIIWQFMICFLAFWNSWPKVDIPQVELFPHSGFSIYGDVNSKFTRSDIWMFMMVYHTLAMKLLLEYSIGVLLFPSQHIIIYMGFGSWQWLCIPTSKTQEGHSQNARLDLARAPLFWESPQPLGFSLQKECYYQVIGSHKWTVRLLFTPLVLTNGRTIGYLQWFSETYYVIYSTQRMKWAMRAQECALKIFFNLAP